MDEEIQFYLNDAEESMGKAVAHVSMEMARIRAGKASPAMLDSLKVDYYGTPTPLSQVANVSAPDARSLHIKPWEKNMVGEIVKAIKNSDLGLNPMSDADGVRLNIPPMTEERRRDLVNEALRKLQKDGAAEDAVKDAETKVQKYTDAHIVEVDKLLTKKESEIMTV